MNERRSLATIRVIDQGKDVWQAERELKEEKKRFEKKLEEMKKELENYEKYVNRQREDLEEATKESREADQEKEPCVKRYKQMLYEYHSVATKLSFDEGISQNGKIQYLKFMLTNFVRNHDRQMCFLQQVLQR